MPQISSHENVTAIGGPKITNKKNSSEYQGQPCWSHNNREQPALGSILVITRIVRDPWPHSTAYMPSMPLQSHGDWHPLLTRRQSWAINLPMTGRHKSITKKILKEESCKQLMIFGCNSEKPSKLRPWHTNWPKAIAKLTQHRRDRSVSMTTRGRPTTSHQQYCGKQSRWVGCLEAWNLSPHQPKTKRQQITFIRFLDFLLDSNYSTYS